MIYFIFIYIILASTIGAYYMAKIDSRNCNENITLFHVLGNIFPSLILSWFLFFVYICNLIVINKRK